MVAVGIIGIITAISLPTFISYWQNSTLNAGAQEVTTILNNARQLAISQNQTVCVKTDVTNPTYGTRIRYLLSSCAGTAWTGPGTDGSGYMTLSNSLQIQPPATDLQFTYLGATVAGQSFRVKTPTNGNTATITVATSGRISTGYP
jgi:Tfp pilus assembly protein FimT